MTDLSASINAAGYAEIILRTRSALQECAADDIMALSVAPHMARQEYRLRELFVVMTHVDDYRYVLCPPKGVIARVPVYSHKNTFDEVRERFQHAFDTCVYLPWLVKLTTVDLHDDLGMGPPGVESITSATKNLIWTTGTLDLPFGFAE